MNALSSRSLMRTKVATNGIPRPKFIKSRPMIWQLSGFKKKDFHCARVHIKYQAWVAEGCPPTSIYEFASYGAQVPLANQPRNTVVVQSARR